jgi:hypothetical protein
MPTLRVLGAFTFGVLLYQVVVVYIGGVVAAVQIPQSYFASFGRANTEVALAVLQFASFALPTAVLVAGGTLAAHRMLAGNTKAVLVGVLAGLLAGFAFWAIAAGPPLVPPWWAVSGLIAPWVGFALAAWLVARKVGRAG